MTNFEHTSQLSNMKPFVRGFAKFMSQLTDEQLAEAGLEIMKWKRNGAISDDNSIIYKLLEWVRQEGDFRDTFNVYDVEKYITDEIVIRFSNKIVDIYRYGDIEVGQDIWYFDENLKDMGELPTKGVISYINYDNGKIDTIGVDFGDDADEFWVDDKTFGHYLFLSRESITAKYGI